MPTSVVIVNYNSGEYLQRCLVSLFASDISLEIVVVDNASTDNSAECVDSLDAGRHQLRLSHNNSNVGFAAAVNIGVANTNSDIVVLLNPDSIVHFDSIRALVHAFDGNTNIAITGGLVFNHDGTEQNGCRRREPNFVRSAIKSLPMLRNFIGGNRHGSLDMSREALPLIPAAVDAVSGSFMAIRKCVFNEVGGMDAGYFLHCEDLDLCRLVRDKDYQVIFVPDANVFHYQGVSSAGQPIRVEWYKRNSMLRYFQKFQAPELNGLQRILIPALVTAHSGRVCLALFVKRLFLNTNAAESLCAGNTGDLAAKTETVLVTGASSVVGGVLIDLLLKQGLSVIALSRSERIIRNNERFSWFNNEYLYKVSKNNFPTIHAAIHLAPIWTLPELLLAFSRLNISRIVAVSSTSVLAKKTSTDKREREVADLLGRAERKASDYAKKYQIALTILRASMIYDGVHDQNISKLSRFIKRFGVFPLVGKGVGLRQPVHVEDVASACVQSMDQRTTFDKTYTISGGRALSYKDMVTEIFHSLSQTPRFISIPLRSMRFAMSLVTRITISSKLSPAMVDRMTANLCYSHDEASQDLAFQPRPFSL